MPSVVLSAGCAAVIRHHGLDVYVDGALVRTDSAEDLIVVGHIFIVEPGGRVHLVGLFRLHRDQGLYVDHSLRLPDADLVDQKGEGILESLVVAVAQLIDAEHDIDLAVLFFLQPCQRRFFVAHPVLGNGLGVHAAGAGDLKDHEGLIGQKVRAADAAVEPKTVGAGIPEKDGVGKPVVLHRAGLRGGEGEIQRRGRHRSGLRRCGGDGGRCGRREHGVRRGGDRSGRTGLLGQGPQGEGTQHPGAQQHRGQQQPSAVAQGPIVVFLQDALSVLLLCHGFRCSSLVCLDPPRIRRRTSP